MNQSLTEECGAQVKDLMTKIVISIDYTMSVKEAAVMMEDVDIGSIIIMKDNKPVGILTERDITRRVVACGRSPSIPVSEVMSSPLMVTRPDETIWGLVDIMKSKKIRRAPVVEKKRLVGIITMSDLSKGCSVSSNSEIRQLYDKAVIRLKNGDNHV